jgi:hypothetical protein
MSNIWEDRAAQDRMWADGTYAYLSGSVAVKFDIMRFFVRSKLKHKLGRLSIMDVGAGTGGAFEAMHDLVESYFFSEISPTCAKRFRPGDPKVSLFMGDINAWANPLNLGFDVIIFAGCARGLYEPALPKRLMGWLVDGGLFFFEHNLAHKEDYLDHFHLREAMKDARLVHTVEFNVEDTGEADLMAKHRILRVYARPTSAAPTT